MKIEIELPDETYNKLNRIYAEFNKNLIQDLQKQINKILEDLIEEIKSLL